MREIKFRVAEFDKSGENFEGFVYLDPNKEEFDSKWLKTNDPLTSVHQFTGLKDKNGKEIYEEDICKITNGKSFIAPIIYEGSMFIPDTEYAVGKMVSSLGFYDSSEIEVIGNIYENNNLIN